MRWLVDEEVEGVGEENKTRDDECTWQLDIGEWLLKFCH